MGAGRGGQSEAGSSRRLMERAGAEWRHAIHAVGSLMARKCINSIGYIILAAVYAFSAVVTHFCEICESDPRCFVWCMGLADRGNWREHATCRWRISASLHSTQLHPYNPDSMFQSFHFSTTATNRKHMAANNETPKWTVVKSYPTSIGLCGGLIYALAPIVIVVIGLTVYQADDTNEGLVALYICLVVAAVVGTLLLGASQLTTDICEEGIHTYWRFGYPYRHLEFSEISEVKESVYNCWHFGGFGCRVGVCKWRPSRWTLKDLFPY